MRDLVLFAHIILGLAIVVLSVLILLELKKKKSSLLKPLSGLSAVISWILLIPSGYLYINFYPATKTLIQAGAWPWAHSIIMETKEHWGILLPIAATVAAWLVFSGKTKESRRWWVLVIALSILLAVMGRVIKTGAGMQ